MTWLAENWGTIVILAGLGTAIFFIIRKIIKDQKCGMGTCGCGCRDCAMHATCHSRAKKA